MTPPADGATAPLELDPELFLPEPDAAERHYTVISVDDHVVEPAHVFSDYLPSNLVDRGPALHEDGDGGQHWHFDGRVFTMGEANAFSGRRPETVERAPFRLSNMRPGAYDVHARIADMDLNGVWASLNFPSIISGFCGRVFFNAADQEIGRASIRAWNDWLHDEWFREHPERIIPCGLAHLSDPAEAAAEIRRNAERGFVSLSMPERPHAIGLPTWWDTDHWDPIMQACLDTDTVLSFHVGSSGVHEAPAGSPDRVVWATLFGQLSLQACAEFLWSGYPLRHPDLKISMSEGGIGWVPMLIDRLDNLKDRSGLGDIWEGERASEVLRRNFWFCTLDDPSTIELRHVIGVENIMVEVDYPHSDSTWPTTQQVIADAWGHLPEDEVRRMCSLNAAELFRVPLPDPILP
ncbi:MAG: amidohydrolase family protein [Actinomycetota bacterium]